MKRPEASEYASYYTSYIDAVKGDNLMKILENQIFDVQAICSDISPDKENYSYAEGKWTIKEVLGHIIDAERIFAYRALRIARGDRKPLQGFDENAYVANARFDKRKLQDFAHEFSVVRESNLILFKTFDEAALDRRGIANDKEVSVRAILFIIAGHTKHHFNVMKQKYSAAFASVI